MNTAGIPAPEKKALAELSRLDTFDWEGTTETILQCCVREFRAESASIFLMQNESESLRLVKAIGPRENHHCGKSLNLGEGISGYVASTRDPLLVADFSNEKRLISREDRYPVDTLMSCPVVKGPLVLAVINVAGRKAGRPFSKGDLKKLQNISDECADVLSRTIDSWRSSQVEDGPKEESGVASKLIDESAREFQNRIGYNESILQSLSEQVLVFNRRYDITYSSREDDFARLFSRGQEVGTSAMPRENILDLPLSIERNDLKRKLDRMIREGEPFSLSNVRVENSERFCVINMSFSPFSSSGGDRLGGLLLVDDNTKNYEMQQRLVEAEKFSLIGSLTSMITHEVNNPLDGVMRLINLSLGQLKEDDPVSEYLTEAQKGLHRIASLVGSLLNFSRKSVSLDSEFTTVNAVIENALTIMRNRNREREISIALDLASENPTVRTNDFYQIISNLLSNSFDAVATGSGELKVGTEVEDGRLHLRVEDNGCGISERVQSRIFTAFYTTKEYGKGTGLGLAIVKKMIEKYDGMIEMDSEENRGTRIHLTFSLERLMP